jgi:hypothetical protein
MGLSSIIRRSFIAAIALLATTTGAAAASTATPGIYEVWGSTSDVAHRSYVQGGQVVVQWKDVEPHRGTFNWSSLYSQLDAYHAMGKDATVQINSTTAKPAWVWNLVARCGTVHGQAVPQYWDPLYLTLQQELVDGLATAIRSYAHPETVALVRANPNAIGTELTMLPPSWRCSATPSGHIASGGWSKTVAHTYFRNVMDAYRTALLPDIHVALRTEVFVTDGAPLSWLGAGGAWIMGTGSDIDYNPTRDAFDVFARRYDSNGTTTGYWEPLPYEGHHNLVSWNYWRILLELYKGVSYIAVYGDQIRQGGNPQYRAAFDFANRFAGSAATPATAPGAFIALKQGRGRTAGNLSRFMVQFEPNTTSTPLDSNQGRNMIGPGTERFGRYARRLNGGTSRAWTGFQLNPDFAAGVAGQKVVISVRYLDAGHGSFRVAWGRSTAAQQIVTKRGSGTWRQARFAVPAAAFGRQLAHSCDISLKALGSSKDVFHMVEVNVPGR